MLLKKKYDSGVMLLTPDRFFHDTRGFFIETKRETEMRQFGIPQPFVQTSFSRSAPFVLRGLHYQLQKAPDAPQGKLMRCIQGSIFHACVDMRLNSPTRGQAWTHNLDDRNGEAVWVPPGFAVGFYTYENGATVHYEMSGYYNGALEKSLVWNDPTAGIKWPFRPGAGLIISSKDREAPRFEEAAAWI